MWTIVLFFMVVGAISWWALHAPKGTVTIEPLQQISIGFRTQASKPVAKPPIPAQKLSMTYRSRHRLTLSKDDFKCLAYNIYYEARGEPRSGKIAVAEVTWNRVRSQRWGKTVCEVVFADKQFSWTNDLSQLRYPHGVEWTASKAAAQAFVTGDRVAQLGRPDHYHTVRVFPTWDRKMKVKGRVGQHVFFASNQ
jgi:spore germination cell wall hydrolase CwlJ-like protein